MGNLNDFVVEIGNFSQEPIKDFVDTKGNPCSYLEYLRDRGPSKSYIYLMTTSRDDSDLSDNDSDLNVHVTVNSETKTKLEVLVMVT